MSTAAMSSNGRSPKADTSDLSMRVYSLTVEGLSSRAASQRAAYDAKVSTGSAGGGGAGRQRCSTSSASRAASQAAASPFVRKVVGALSHVGRSVPWYEGSG